MAHHEYQIGDLTAVIGDNSADGTHRAGYNGLWSLHHKTEPRSLFVPGIAGLNFEHIISGEGEEERDVFFEPRRADMTFRKISDSVAELHQPPTPTFFLDSTTRFELKAPHYIDMEFRCHATQHVFVHDYIALFWASYINAPEDKSMYFPGSVAGRGARLWSQLCPPAHNVNSTVRHREDEFVMQFAEGAPDALYKNFSPLRFDTPMFYGNFGKHIFIVMFDRIEGIRLTQSPSGGGVNKEHKTTNPAWDFQFIIHPYEVLKEYSFRARVVYREKCSRDEIMREYADWKKQLSSVA